MSSTRFTYDKGGAVLAMLEQWIGEKAFRQGLTQYMKDRQFSNATAGDLWHHMQLCIRQERSDVAGSWTEQQGFPVIHLTAVCSEGQTIVQLKQTRFSLGAAATAPTALEDTHNVLTRGAEQRSLLLGADKRRRQIHRMFGCPCSRKWRRAGFLSCVLRLGHAAWSDRIVCAPDARSAGGLAERHVRAGAGRTRERCLPVLRLWSQRFRHVTGAGRKRALLSRNRPLEVSRALPPRAHLRMDRVRARQRVPCFAPEL